MTITASRSLESQSLCIRLLLFYRCTNNREIWLQTSLLLNIIFKYCPTILSEGDAVINCLAFVCLMSFVESIEPTISGHYDDIQKL